MDFPKYPRHLSVDERRAVRNEAARAFADETMAKTEAATGPITDGHRRAATLSDALVQGLNLVALNWHEERLAEIEASFAASTPKPTKKGGR